LDKSDSRVSLQLKKLKSNFLSLGKEYANEFRLPLVDPCSMVVSKYSPSKEMGPHVDSTEDMNARALMTAILYLNDDYEGGDLYFPEQEIRLKPKAGSIVFFPSVQPFYHQSFKITKGYKYIVPLFWVQYL
jgi:predicted 2-oxoglutarate/Fe(II)-dependent dioxygenase YbiX